MITVEGTLPAAVPLDAGMLAAVEGVLGYYRSPQLEDLPPLHGGIVGYLGYEVVREVEHLPDAPPDDRGLPDAAMSIIGSIAAFDHWKQRVVLLANAFVEPGASADDLDAAYDDAVARVERMLADGARALDEPVFDPPAETDPLPDVARTVSKERYTDMVAVAREHILAGDIFQVVLSQRFDLTLDAEPFDMYRSLRQVNPSPYMYFIRHPEVTVVGSSPEPMVQLLDGRVISRPIAGTRRRGRTEADERRMAAELTEDPKERAEHVMLVDLARNDVGRVGVFGTEKVDEFFTLERYSHVMHLTSQVSADLRAGARTDRCAAGDAARRHRVGSAEGAGHADHRRARADAPRPVRGCGRLRRLRRATRHRDRDPHDVRCARRPRQRAGRRRHRGRQRPGLRRPGMRQQGGGAAGRGARGAAHDGSTQSRCATMNP